MRKGKLERRMAQLELRALYRIGELAELTRVSKHVLWRLLEQRGVQRIRIGRWPYVPLSEIHEKVPLLWKSICSSCLARRTEQREAPKAERGARTGSPGDPQASR